MVERMPDWRNRSLDWRGYPPLEQAHAELAQLEAQAAALETALREATARVQAIRARLDAMEASPNGGTRAELAAVRRQYEQATQAEAEARQALEQNLQARRRLEASLVQLEEEGKRHAVVALQIAYQEAVAKLAQALEAAAAANAEVQRLYSRAREEFPGPPKDRHFPPAAGLLPLAWDELDHRQGSKLSVWLAEVRRSGYTV